jgi:serine/threonine-protein phosphatase PGAM5
VTASTTLYLARHGTAAGDSDEPGLGLSAQGEAEASLLGARLAGLRFDRIRHSPLRRAADTAAILAAHLPDVPVTGSEWLADLTPVPRPGDEDTVPEAYRWFPGTVPADERDPGGVRLDTAYDALTATGADSRRELLVTHNFVIGWFVRRVMQAPEWRWMGLNQRNCALTVIRVSPAEPAALISFNDCGHLPPDGG